VIREEKEKQTLNEKMGLIRGKSNNNNSKSML